MGSFLAVTAFKTGSVADVAAAITDYVTSHGVLLESVAVESPLKEHRDAQIYAPVNGWTVVLWPPYFSINDFPLARAVASARSWLVSTIHVWHGEYWEHLCCLGGAELHAFCSRPRYWQDMAPANSQRKLAYASEPTRLASQLGISPHVIEPYIVDVDTLPDPEPKAHADDEFALGNFWVLADFWRRLGIPYPTPPENLTAVLRLGYFVTKNLPRCEV